jgi:HPt (histidine-containing phosphotransfer) domain-containing protein
MHVIIDIDHLDQQTFADKDLKREVLGMFLEQAPLLIEAMEAGHGAVRSDTAHRLRGSCLAIGAVAMAEAVSAIEENPQSGPALSLVRSLAETTMREIAKLLAA